MTPFLQNLISIPIAKNLKVNVYHKMEKDKFEEYLYSWGTDFNKIKHKYITNELWETFKSALEFGVKKIAPVRTIRKKNCRG